MIVAACFVGAVAAVYCEMEATACRVLEVALAEGRVEEATAADALRAEAYVSRHEADVAALHDPMLKVLIMTSMPTITFRRRLEQDDDVGARSIEDGAAKQPILQIAGVPRPTARKKNFITDARQRH